MSELRYAYDLYPRDDPLGGARILRFSDLEEAEWNAEANGTGSGVIILPGDSTDAGSIDPRGLQYIRVVEIDPDDPDGGTLSGFAERVVHGFFLDTGSFDALTEQNTKRLTFGGAGTLSYWARAVMAPHTYIHDVFTGQDPFDRTWRLDQQSTVFANGNYTGAMLWRVLYELSHFRSGATYTHKHADGVIYNDAHDDDRTESAVPAAVIDFTAFLDSNGNAWTEKVGEFRVSVLDNGLSVIRLLMELGAYVEMDPHTFETRAYQASSHRRDRTGGAWGASVIRFQSPTDGTLDTGNILSDAKRALTAHIQRSTMWAGGGDDVYAKATGTFDIPWEGGLNSDANDLDALEVQADRQITARSDAGDTLRVRSVPIDDPASGFYRPLHSTGILLDDLATVHNGAGQWDFDEQTFPVAAVGGKLREGADWDTFFDLGASFRPMEGRQFQVASLGSHTHPPNPRLCEPGVLGSTPTTVLDTAFGESGASFTTPFNILTSAEDQYLIVGVGFNGPDWSSGDVVNGVTWKPDVGDAGQNQALSFLGRKVGSLITMEIWGLANPTPAISGPVIHTSSGTASDRTVMGAVLVEGTDQAPTIGTGGAGTGTASSDSVASSANDLVLNWASIREEDPLTAALGLTELAEYQLGSASSRISIAVGSETAAGAETSGWTHASFSWVSMSAAFAGVAGVPGDGHPLLIGTSKRAKRCDDTEHYHTTADPTVDDDAATGFRNGTMWINESTGAMFLLLDNAEGAADWLAVGGAGADLSGIDFLVGTASGDLSAEIVVGATPGGELGGTWAAPTVDATHSGSTHAASTDTHIADASDAHDASAVSVLDTGAYFTGTDVEAVLQELGASGDIADALSAKASGSGDVTTTASLADVTGATLSLDAGTYVVVGIFDTLVNNALNDRTWEGHLDSGGADENDYANLVAPGLVNVRATVSQSWRLVLASTTTVKLRTLHSGGTVGDFTVKSTNTTLTAYRAGGGGIAGTELAYVEFTATVSPTATTAATANAVVSAGSIAFDGSPVMIEFFSPQGQAPTGGAGRQLLLELYADTAAIGIIGILRTDGTVAADGSVVRCSRRLTPSAASHTYEIKAWVTAGTGTVGAGAGGAGTVLPGYIRIVSV